MVIENTWSDREAESLAKGKSEAIKATPSSSAVQGLAGRRAAPAIREAPKRVNQTNL
jgi:hypothetical protein